MKIKDKIEEIRKKPEQVRIYWAWGLTILITSIIVFFWIITIKNQTQNLKVSKDQKNLINEFQKPKKSIKEATQEIQKIQKKVQVNYNKTEVKTIK